MALTCPNINMPEWKTLEAAVGKMEAYRDYMETDGLIRTPEVVRRKLDTRGTSLNYQLTDLDVVGEPIGREIVSNMLNTLKVKFDTDVATAMIHEPENLSKGYVENRNGRTTVVINTAYATLDTPLHEFGHIFLTMLKSNWRVYGKLMAEITKGRAPGTDKFDISINDKYKTEYDRVDRLYRERFEKEVNLYAEDKDMLKVNAEYMAELEAKVADPKGEDLTEAEEADLKDLLSIQRDMDLVENMVREELVVELLGKFAAGHIDPSSGVYKLVKDFWDAIVDIIKSIIDPNGIVDVLKLDPRIGLEELANMLANPEVKFTSATELKAKEDAVLEPLRKLNRYKAKAVERIQEFVDADPDSVVYMKLNDLSFMVASEVAESLVPMMESRDEGRSEPKITLISRYLRANFTNDTTAVLKEASEMQGDPVVKLSELKQKYGKWFAVLRLAYDEGDMIHTDNLLSGYIASTEAFGMEHINEAEDIKADVRNTVGYTYLTAKRTPENDYIFDDQDRIDHVVSKTLSNTDPSLQRLFGVKGLYYSQTRESHPNVEEWLQEIKEQIDDTEHRISRIREGSVAPGSYFNHETGQVETLDSKWSFDYEQLDSVTGRIEKDVITVTGRINLDNELHVTFRSKIWDYSDTFFAQPLSNIKPVQLKRRVGKIDLALQASGERRPMASGEAQQLFYDPQGIYAGLGSRPDTVVMAVGKGTFGPPRDAVRLTNSQVIAHYDNLGNPDIGVSDPHKLDHFEIPISQLVAVRNQGRTDMMNKVVDQLSQMYPERDISAVSFSPAEGVSLRDEKKGGKKRDRLYKLFGEAMFKAYHNELKIKYATTSSVWSDSRDYKFLRPDGEKVIVEQHKVIVPQNFRKGLIIDRTLYQKTDPAESRLPFGDTELQESVIGQAILNDAKENRVDPVLSDQTAAVDLAKRLSDMLGVSYQVITADEAAALTADAPNPWSGQKAFFVGDMVYFVGDHLTTKDVFHEFAHPFLRHIAGTNPKLFSNLYNQLDATPEGQAIIEEVRETHPDLDEGSDLFKEEVIVKALTAVGMDKLNNFKTESRFAKVINNILYAIKQALRKMFGKVPVSGLNENTTLEELADMLVKGGKFEVDKTIISESDVIAYNKERTQYVDDLINIDDDTIQTILNKEFDIASNHINQLLSNRNYDTLRDLLTDPDRRGDLQELKSNIQAYQTSISNLASRTVKDMEYMRNRSTALVNSIFRLKTVMSKILEHVQDMKEQGESQENMHKAHYYEHLIDHWQNFVDEAVDALSEQDLDEESPMFSLLNQIKRATSKTKRIINDMYAEGARDALYDELLPMQEKIKLRYETMIQNLRDKNAPQKKIDRYYKQYHGVTEAEHKRLNELKRMRKSGVLPKAQETEMNNLQAKADNGIAITPEKIEKILKGGMGDVNFFNAYLEGYLYSADPVVGGLASYVKNHLNEVMVKAQGTYNKFSKEMQPLLEDAGFNPVNPARLGEELGFLDTVAKREDDGTITPRKVWTFLNPFRDYRHDYDVHKDTVEKAQQEYQRSGTAAAEKAMVDAITARQKFMRKYFHQEYVSEFYERDALFEKDDIGKKALLKRKQWGADYRALTEPANTPDQQLEITGEVDLMWREWRQMSSMYYMNGSPKRNADGTPNEDGQIALRIKEYNELSRKFYENRPRKGVFQNALRSYEQQLIDEGNAIGSEEFTRKRKIWISQNVVRVPKETWYQRTRELYTRQSEILSKLDPEMRRAMDEQLIMDQIFDLQGGFKDEYGQTKAVELSPESRAQVIALEKQLQEMRASATARNGLTPEQNARFSELHEIRKTGSMTMPDGTTQAWGPSLQRELSALYDIKNTMGLTKFERDELESIRTELAGISKREATSYYVDIMNTWLGELTIPSTGIPIVNKATADTILEPNVIDSLLGQNEKFDEWFYASHIQKDRWNSQTKKMEKVWTRSTVWSQTIPIDPSQYETFEITDSDGNIEVIQGKPIQKYFSRVVKPEYRKEKIVGVTVDNKYQWLPKSREEGSKDPNWDSKYINEEYEEMRANDPKKFKALEKMKEWHLRNQEGISRKGRLYYDYPRYRKENLELVQSKDFFQNMVKRIKEWFHGAKDDAESGFNDVDKFNLVRMDMFDNDITDVPIHGLYDIDNEDVSTDITLTMMQYMLSGERQKQLIKISPMARAVQSVVSAEANKIDKEDSKGFKFINRFNFFNNGVISYGKQKGDSVRKKTIDNFLEREFEGKRMTGAGSDVPWLNNTASLLFKRASFGFFAFNIPSALKNSYGAKFQGLIEASAGEHMTHASFQKGNVWSYGTMGELSFGGQLYKKGPRSLRQQIVEIFDPSQDRFEEKFGEGLSRTVAKDAAGMTWLYNFRKWVELQATIQIFGGMMYHQKVTQTLPDGTTKEIPYMEAWELKDDLIQLKEGIDPTWGITYDEDGNMKMGDKFSRYKNTVHQVMNNLQGAYAKFDQPEAQRYLVFRFLSYLRRYFTTMTMNRFGFTGRWGDPQPRLNPGLGDVQMGYYVQFIQTLKDTITDLGRNLMYLTGEEKKAAFKVMTELGALFATTIAMSLLFGWDPDDDERFEKLRERSGALPFPMGSEDPDRPFNGWGFIENHMLYLLMNIRSENEQFLPFPGYGLDDYSAMLDLKSIAFGPTVQTYKEIFEDALDIVQGNESAYYKRDVGPYEWQQQGGAKIWAHIGRTLGLTGSALDPAKGIKGFQSVQARARR